MDVNEMVTIPDILRSSIHNQYVSSMRNLAENSKSRAGTPPKSLKMEPKFLKMGKLGGC